jgi:hypothetical protein
MTDGDAAPMLITNIAGGKRTAALSEKFLLRQLELTATVDHH